jgi:hypothetical protein
MKIEGPRTTAAASEEARETPRGYYQLSAGRPVQRKAFPPSSLANLRPPWPPGMSGNPKGRPRGIRDRRSVRAEQIGKKVMKFLPHLVDKIERLTTINDYGAFYRKRMCALSADPKTAMDASRIAALEVEAYLLEQQFPSMRIRKGYVCCRCGVRLLDNDVVPLSDATGVVAWFHPHCVLSECYDRRDRARAIVSKVPL